MPERMKKKKKKAELPKVKKLEKMHHPVETFSAMSKNLNRQSEAAFSNAGAAVMHLRIAKNADGLREYQAPLGSRFYQLLRSL